MGAGASAKEREEAEWFSHVLTRMSCRVNTASTAKAPLTA